MRIALLALILLAAGCRTTPPPAPAPMDAPLRHDLDAAAPDAQIDVLIGIGDTDAETARRDLTAVGLDVRTIAGGVAVARGVPAAIGRASALPFVERIERSQTRPPLPQRP